MNKCHTPIGWQNDTTPAINETNLNYMDGCIDTIDDRVVAMDTAKLEPSDVASVIKNITFNDTTGIFIFTRYDDSTFTLDTKLEKVVTNWSYDSSTQSLVLTLADGSTVNIPLSDFITETEFEDSATIGFTVLNHTVTAVVKANSIGDAQMQTGYLTDCQAAASQASAAASTSNTNQLISEGFANGTQGGVPVSSGSPYYENNAKYWRDQAHAIVSNSFAGLDDVSFNNLQDGQVPVYDAANQEWVNGTPASSASDISYDNTSSGLAATNVQDAVDEVNGAMQYLYNNTGGKNQIVYPYAETSRVHNGITFTDNGDGTIKATGTASGGNAVFYVINNTAFPLKMGNYILNGCPSGGSQNSYWIGIQTGGATIAADIGNSDAFTLSSDNPTGYIFLAVMNGTALPAGGITFKPMIRDASISDDTYVPYAMTNRELTDRVQFTDGSITPGSTTTVTNSFNYFKIGKLVVVTLFGIKESSGATDAIIGTDLPVFRSTVLANVQNDTDITKSALVYGNIGQSVLHISAHTANTAYYGQFVYYTD